jgi:hypothetical protein
MARLPTLQLVGLGCGSEGIALIQETACSWMGHLKCSQEVTLLMTLTSAIDRGIWAGHTLVDVISYPMGGLG